MGTSTAHGIRGKDDRLYRAAGGGCVSSGRGRRGGMSNSCVGGITGGCCVGGITGGCCVGGITGGCCVSGITGGCCVSDNLARSCRGKKNFPCAGPGGGGRGP